MFNDYTDWRSSTRDQISYPVELLITLIEDLQEGIKSPPLFYVEESEIAYKGETREFGKRVFEDLYSTLKSQSLLQHRWLKWDFHRFTIIKQWKGAPYFRTKPDGYKIILNIKMWEINMYET